MGYISWGEDNTIISHFGDERSGITPFLNRFWAESEKMTIAQLPTADRIMMSRGGDGIEFDAMGQLSLGFLAADIVAVTSEGIAALTASTKVEGIVEGAARVQQYGAGCADGIIRRSDIKTCWTKGNIMDFKNRENNI